MTMLVRPQATLGDRTVVDGVAVAVVDLEHSSARFTNTITHSYDTVVSITMPALPLHSSLGSAPSRAPTKEIRVFCKSRQGELFRIEAQAIQDVRRRYVDGETVVVVEVDFVAAAPVLSGTQVPFAALATKMREYRATFQVLRDEGKTELLFGAILAAWRMITSSSTLVGATTAVRSAPTLLQPVGGYDAASSRHPHIGGGGFAFPFQRASEASKWAPSSPPPHTSVASEYTVLTDAEDTFPCLVGRSRASMDLSASSLRTDVELRHATRRETERMLNNCSQLETELQLIRQRRQQRQQQLMLVDAQGPTGMSTSFTGDPWALTESVTATPADAPHVDVYDPEALRYGFTTLCPHCGIHSSNSHRETCPKRTVQCMRCRSMMPLGQFATHASLCVRQRDPSNKNHAPSSPDPYLNGTAVPSPDDGDDASRAQERLAARGALPSSHVKAGVAQADVAPAATPSRSATAARLGTAPAAAPPPGPSENHGAASAATIAFADIPRTRSIIIEKEDRDADRAQESQQQHHKSIRFVDDTGSSPVGDRTRTPRRRLTTFVDNPIQTCPWCKKPAPDDHPKKCAERRILCTLCGEEVFLRDKRAHRVACAGQLEASGAAGTRSRHDDEYDEDLQRRMSKIAAYKQRLDTLRRANELNGTPAGRRLSSN